MKESAVQAQMKRLEDLENRAKAAKYRAQRLADYVQSAVYRDALLGEHDFFDPGEGHRGYRDRVAFYAGRDEGRLQALLEEAHALPKPEGQRWDHIREVRIGIIADDFLFESIENAAEFIPISPSNFHDVVPAVDVLLVVSAWRGLDKEWFGFGNANSDVRELYDNEILPLARENSIPVVFYSKEDPPNFQKFIGLAKTADFVFTSASEMVPKYQEILGDSVPVQPLRFAVNYRIHNPLGCERHTSREVIFAGSWFAQKYKHRSIAAAKIFQGVSDSSGSLTIFDRNANLSEDDFSDLTKYHYPDQFLSNLRFPLPHQDILALQKLLPFAINLNSVIDSETMFANRVVELLAMGTVVLSNYSNGMNTLYPYVAVLDSAVDAQQFVDNSSDDYLRYSRAEGIRDVFLKETSYDRIDQILDAIGLEYEVPEHRILVVCEDESGFEAFAASQATEFELQWRTPRQLEEEVGAPGGDLVIMLDRIDLNSPDLIDDAVAAFRYCDVDWVEFLAYDDDSKLAYEPSESSDSSGAHAVWLPAGSTVAETDLRRFIRVRTSASIGQSPRAVGNDRQISVIVPVYNNGRFLVHKCFQSLRRSSIFDNAEVLLVDDGSTDLKTKHVLTELEKRYENVTVFSFPEGGSGSASRPRNKGLEMCHTPYVTYLDPDNEQTNDGYAELLELIQQTGAHFALGNMVRFKGSRSLVNNSWTLKKGLRALGAEEDSGSYQLNGNNVELIKKIEYQPMSIQALVADTNWLKNLGLVQPVGAVGQDSYFFQQMLFYAENVALKPIPIHIYYAEVANSTVNSISSKFFRKYLPLEADRSQWLKEVGLLEHYSATRFLTFLKGWYLQKLKSVSAEERASSLQLLREIAEMYGPDVLENVEYLQLMAEASD